MKSNANSIRPPELDGPAAGTWRSTIAWAWMLCGGLVAVALACLVFGDMPGRLALGLSLTSTYAGWCLWRWRNWRGLRHTHGADAPETRRARRIVIRHYVVVPLLTAIFAVVSVPLRLSNSLTFVERCQHAETHPERIGLDCDGDPPPSLYLDLPLIGLIPGAMALGPISVTAVALVWFATAYDRSYD